MDTHTRKMKLEITYIASPEGAKAFNSLSTGNQMLEAGAYALTVCAHDNNDVACGLQTFNDFTKLMPKGQKAPDPEELMYTYISEVLINGLKGDK